MEQIPVIGSEGKPVRYANLENGSRRFEFEYYERFEGEGDCEIIHSVAPEDFPIIAEKFGLDPILSILELVKDITDASRGEELKDALNSNEIPNELWTWLG